MQRFYPPAAEPPAGVEESDSEDDAGAAASHRAKPRRKAHQRPQGSDQIRQAFSKRKKGLVLKSYQLFKLTDAKVFMFVVNDKGSSWAYSTPGFGAPLGLGLLRQLRDMAGVGDIAAQSKCHTEIMPHPTIADHDPSADDRDNYVTPRGRARSTEGTVYAAPPARGGRACSSFSGASGGVEFSAVRGGDGTADGARARSGAQAAARAVSGVSKSRGAGCKVEDADEQMRARPPSGMSVNTLNCPASGLPAFQGSLPLPLPLVCSGAGAGDSPTRAVPAAARSAAPHGGMYMPPSHMDGTMSDPNSSVSAPTAAAVGVGSMSLQQQQSQAMAGPQMGVMPACSAAYGMQLPGATPGYLLGDYMDLMDEHPDGMQHHLQQQQQPMQQHMQQQPMQQAMQQQSCITSAGGQMVIVNGQQGAATTPNFHLQHQQAVGSPSAAAAVAAPPPVFARTSSPAPAGDPFSSLQARLPPLRTRLQQGWPDDVAAQVHSAPAGMVNAMLGPCTMAAGSLSGPNSEGAGPHLPDTLREHGGARGCSAYGAAPQPAFLAPHMMGGANKGAAQLASGANGGPFSQFGGAASAARFADGSEPSPTASIGCGVAALAMDSSPCTPVQKDSPVAVPPPQQHAGWQPEQGAALPAPNGAFCGSAGTSAAAAAAAAANINISPDEAFLDDPVLAGFWVMDTPHQQSGAPESGLPHPMLQQPQQQQLSCGSGLVVQVPHMPMQQQGPPMQLPYPGPMQQQMQQVAVQLQALQQQQQAMQQQLLMQQQQAAQMQQQQQQHSPRAGSTAAAAPNHPSPVSRERLLDALSAQISAMTPEMRVQLQLQLEASTAPSSAPAAAMAGQQQPAVATTDGSGCGGGGGGVAQRAQSVGAPPTNMLHGPSRLSATSPAITAGSDPSVVAAAASSCMPAPQQHQQASPSYVMPTMPPPGPASPAPAVAATSASPVPDCSSPLKRGPASRALGGAAFGQEDSGSPLKRHRGLPEPPSFATLVQTDLAADDAMAWALHASFNGTVHAAEGSTAAEAAAAAAVVLGDDDDTLAQLEDADWAPVD